MSLQVGARLGPYEIVALLGAGGMGEVYKARDTRLERVVAIKVLSSALVGDAEFRDRFEREARTISQLTHPHICVLHDIGHHEGTDFLVMEFLDGESLAARIERGPLKIEDALRIAIQIARALHVAHRAGIVHRDLKPGNVMLSKAGAGSPSAPQAKLLDFGLAKHGSLLAHSAGAGQTSPNLTAPPTLTSPLTMRGSIVGTLHYMAPEQLEGTEVDTRSDMFAFGAVLYEMLSGKKAFTGKSQVSVMAAILDHDPSSVASLVPGVPAALDRLIRKCLAKDPERRWQNAGDVASELEWIAESPAQHPVDDSAAAGRTAETFARQQRISARRLRAWIASAIALPLVAAGVVWALMRAPAATRPQPMRFGIVPPPGQPLATFGPDRDVAISPDGTRIAYVATIGGQRQLMVRTIDQIQAVPLRGITTARVPFFSPDGKWIGYFDSATELKKISVTGGPPIALCKISGPPRGATWAADDTIIFTISDSAVGLLAVPAGGGEAKVLTRPDTAKGESNHWSPFALPGGRAVLFTIVATSSDPQVAVLDLKNGQQKTLIRGGAHPAYADSGHLVYAALGALRAVRFDPVKLDILSDPVPVMDDVMMGRNAADFSVSRSGALLYVPGGDSASTARTLAWIDRNGREEPIKAPPRGYLSVDLSPDDTRIAVSATDLSNPDIWIVDLARGLPTRLTFDPGADTNPVWTPDGRWIAFRSTRGGAPNVFRRAADGTGDDERLTSSPNSQIPFAFSPDGLRLVFNEAVPGTGLDLFVVSSDGKGTPQPLVQTAFVETNADLSPDGRWLVYQSNESGRNEVYVRPFPNAGSGGHWLVSGNGGTVPAWGRTGTEIFYVEPGNSLMAVPIRTSPTFSVGTPTKVVDPGFVVTSPTRTYDVSRDGRRVLVIKNPQADLSGKATPASMIVVLNWFEELKARLPNP
jgi:WD40 repeat protein